MSVLAVMTDLDGLRPEGPIVVGLDLLLDLRRFRFELRCAGSPLVDLLIEPLLADCPQPIASGMLQRL